MLYLTLLTSLQRFSGRLARECAGQMYQMFDIAMLGILSFNHGQLIRLYHLTQLHECLVILALFIIFIHYCVYYF